MLSDPYWTYKIFIVANPCLSSLKETKQMSFENTILFSFSVAT